MAWLPTTYERKWPTVLISPISVSNHIITVASTNLLHSKQKITLRLGANAEEFEIKRVLSDTQFHVGPIGSDMASYSNPIAFNGGSLEMSEQNRNPMGWEIVGRAVYDEEPIVALRTVTVDRHGCYIDSVKDINGINRLAVDANITLGDVSVGFKVAKNLAVQNVTVALSNTEQAFALPLNIIRFMVRVRDSAANIQLAFTLGQSGTVYFQNHRGSIFDSGEIDTGIYNVYYQVDKPNVTLEWLLFTS